MDSSDAPVLKKSVFAAGIPAVEEQRINEQFLSQFEKGEVVKTDPHSQVRFIQLGDRRCVAKYYADKGFIGKLKRKLGFGRPWRVFRLSRLMADSSLSIPAPIAYLETSHGAYYLSAQMQNTVDLRVYESSPDKEQFFIRESLIEKIATALASFHQQRFFHGDMKWGNVLYSESESRVTFVDMDAAKETGSEGLFARDVARFMVSLHEAGMREGVSKKFLSVYIEQRGMSQKASEAAFAKRIERWMNRFQQRHQKRYGDNQ